MLKGDLKSLGEDFGASILKTEFPHKFASLENLSYVGATPSIDNYKDITANDYKSLLRDDWSFRDESLKYLINDVESLREILIKFGTEVYNLYNINITKHKTLPALAFSIFLSNFYSINKNPIKIIKGDVEKNIREAYYGGIVSVFEHEIKNGFYYDKNSHYPHSMKNPMPIGVPVYTDNKNLDELFGFVKAKVVTPSASILKNPILPVRTEKGLTCPRGTFYGWWFSEELKNAVKYGYKVSVIGGWTFQKSNELFDKYVDQLYEIKAKATAEFNPSRRATAKLLLNSLPGRMGMNEINTRVKIIPTAEAEEQLKKINWIEFINMGNFSMIIYTGKLEPELNKIIDSEGLEDSKSPEVTAKRRGDTAYVSIAAAVTAYARIELSRYFNLPNNDCIYCDTDSVVLKFPLDSSEVGSGLGEMKLEYKIDHGIFISPKTYGLKYKDSKTGEEEFKLIAKGIGGDEMIFEDYENLLAGHDIIKDKTYLSQQLNKVLCEYTHNHLRSKVLKTRSVVRPGLGRYGLRQRSRPLPRRRRTAGRAGYGTP